MASVEGSNTAIFTLPREEASRADGTLTPNCEIHNRKDQSSTDKALTPEGKTKSRENHVRTDQASMQNCESQNSEDNLCIDKTSTPDCGSQVGKINLSMRGILMPTCGKHRDEEVEIYCHTCKKAVCTTCVRKEHANHDFVTITKLIRKLTISRQTLLQETRNTVRRKFLANRRNISQTIHCNETLLSMKRSQLEVKRKVMLQAVNEIIDYQLDATTANNENLNAEVKKIEKRQLEKEEEVMRKIENFAEATMEGFSLIETYEDLKSVVDNIPCIDLTKFRDRKTYREGEVDHKSLTKMIGEVVDISSARQKMKKMSSFRYKPTRISAIRPISLSCAWVLQKNDEGSALLSVDGSVQKTSMARKPWNPLEVRSNFQNKTIVKISDSGDEEIIMSTAPLYPVHAKETMNGNILISLVDQISGTRNPNSVRKIQMVAAGGQLLHTYQYGKDGQTPVLTYIYRVRQNYNLDICVVNLYELSKSDCRGNICVFHEDGGLKFIYGGKGTDHCMTDICFDSLCNIMCANAQGDIHLIDCDGTFLTFLFSRKVCLQAPTAIALDGDVLWIGSENGVVEVYRYSL